MFNLKIQRERERERKRMRRIIEEKPYLFVAENLN
jgi:hypothetical protein